MTANPLMRAVPMQAPSLDEHVATLNKMNWVKASGRPYFVGSRRQEDGTDLRYVDRVA